MNSLAARMVARFSIIGSEAIGVPLGRAVADGVEYDARDMGTFLSDYGDNPQS